MKQYTTFAIIALLLLLSGCGQNAIDADAQSSEKVKIGVSEPFTGPTAFIGKWVRTGIEMAYSQLPPEDQARIEFVYEDDGCSGKQAVTALQKLISADSVDYIIGPTCNAAAIPTISLMRDSGTVYLSTGVITEDFAKAGDHHFTLQPRIKDLMYRLAEHAYNAKGARTMAIFQLDDEFGRESAMHFTNRFTELGGKIVAHENFAPTDTDFRTGISKLKKENFDGIFMMSYGSWLINQLKQMDELGLKTQIYGPVPVQDPAIIKAAGRLAEGIIYPYPDENPKTQKQLEFEAAYNTKFGTLPEIYSTIGYDTFNVLWQAIQKCGKDNKCAKNHLAQLNSYHGAGGIISLDEDGVAKHTIVMKQIANQTFVAIG